MKKRPQPECPECEKLLKVSEESNKIGSFIDWLINKKGVTFARFDDDSEEYIPHPLDYLSINQLLGVYFEVDLDKVEKERRALLDWVREQQEKV